jgi:hypothetical protein
MNDFIKNKYMRTKGIVTKLCIALFAITAFISCDNDDDNNTQTTLASCDDVVIIPTGISPFTDDFQAYDVFTSPSAWTSVNELGERTFLVKAYQGNNFLEMTSFNSNEMNKTWLISQQYDFSAMVDKNMSFTLADALQNGNPLKLMYSTDYDGSSCPNGFSWTELASEVIAGLSNNTENDDFNFEPTGDIDISSLSGTGVFAFVYEGDSNGIETKIQIDDVRIGQSLAFVPVLTISGIEEVGETLTANYSPLVDVNGSAVNVTYQWYRANDVEGNGEAIIAGETNATYVTANADSGKFITVKTMVEGVETTTNYVGPITGTVTPPVAAVTITGNAEPGEILTADTSASSDVDGDPLTFVYHWYRADSISGTGETPIADETNETYTIVVADLGKFITVKVIANDGIFDSVEATANYDLIPFSPKVFISELADPDGETRGRFVELYNSGTTDIDLAGWKLIRYTNAGTDPSAEEHHLVGIISANTTFVIGKVSDASTSTADFESIFGFPPDQAADPHSDGTINKVVTPIDSNGDDQILLIAPDGTVMDIFGIIGEDGSGTAHEFEDGRAFRKLTVTESNPVWSASEWDVWNDTGANGTTNDPQIAPGDFTPGVR